MELVKSDDISDLDYFIDFLFEGLEGYAYLVVKDPEDKDSWNTQMFQYPEQVDTLKYYIRTGFEKFEVYIAPVLYASPVNAQRPNVKVTNVVWTEFDGNAPKDWGDYPPSLIVRSSEEGHEHVYWRLAKPLMGPDEIENYTQRITHNFSADTSAWDATQVLRPPATINHKHSGLPTFISHFGENVFDSTVFNSLAEAPKPIIASEWKLAELPSISNVVLKHAFSTTMVRLFETEMVEEGKRSSALMEFAFESCERGLTNIEVFVLLKVLDDRWGKFVGRRDRDKRLAGIITHARNKYPDTDTRDTEPFSFAYNYVTFMETQVQLDYVVDNMLMDSGSLLLAGPSGIGKTQIFLEIMKHICLGKDWLHYKIPKAQRILFGSLEMGWELKKFLIAQQAVLTADEIQLLGENFIIMPHGESWPLNTQIGQHELEKFLDIYEPDGFFVDSIGSAILGNINSQEVVQGYTNYVDSARKRYGMFWGAIHHTRKKSPGQNTSGQDDVYGDQYLVNRASSVYGILPGRDKTIKVDCWKLRLDEKESPYYLSRTEGLNFEKKEMLGDGVVKSAMVYDKETDTVIPTDAGDGKFEL